MLAYVKSVLDFSAFRPEPDDPKAPWRHRFPGRTTALLHIGRNSLEFSTIGPKGDVKDGRRAQGEYKEIFAELGAEIREEAFEGWCVVSMDTRYVISVETNLSRKPGSEAALKKDPRSVLHARFEKGKRYAVTHNPETNSSLLLTLDEENVKKVEGLCKEQKLKIGRICCGTYVLLRHALAATNAKKGSDAPFSALYVACCNGSVSALVQEKDTWIEGRSRPDLYGDDIKPLLDLLQPFQERLGPASEIVLACDEPIPQLADGLAEMFPGRTLKDLSQPGLLGRLIYTN